VNPESERNGTARRGVRLANTRIRALIATFQRTLSSGKPHPAEATLTESDNARAIYRPP